MATNEQSVIDVGAEVANSIYANSRFEHYGVQPIYVLHRDTIRTFLHEKIGAFERKGRILGLAGIEVSLVASLVTATFNDWRGIKGAYIEATFTVLVLVCALYLVRDVWAWLMERASLQVDVLAEDLGHRGSVIKPNAQAPGS
jgi:hypothetical protein